MDFQRFFDSGALPLILADAYGMIARANPAAAELLGRQNPDLRGCSLAEFVAREDRPTLNSLLKTAREAPGSTPSADLAISLGGEFGGIAVTALALPEDASPSEVLLILGDRRDYHLLEERVAYLTGVDPLTGLANRLLLNRQLTKIAATATAQDRSFALIMLGLNRFQEINDSFGHDQGDLLLAEVANRIRSALPEDTFVARSNGVHFVIVADQNPLPLLDQVFSHLSLPFQVAGQPLRLSARAGICHFPADGRRADELQRNAETALRQTREKSRNDYRIYHPEMKLQARRHLALENALVRAMERSELELHYQPLVDSLRGRAFGVEALLRWNHPEMGLILPLKFLPQVASAGLSRDLGCWVLRQACDQARNWTQPGSVPLRTSVNLLFEHFRGPEFVATVGDIIAESGLPAQGVELEVTEQMLIEDSKASRRILGSLNELGVRVAIDDFGTGYSSLGQLNSLPVQTLKIDRSFIARIPGDQDGMAITSAATSLAHSLGLQVIAEGVETPDQLAFLQARDCSCMQGFLFARPMPAAELTAWLQNGGRQLKTYPAEHP